MTIDPTTYTAKFDIDGNGTDDTITFDLAGGKGGTFLHAKAILDNGTTKELGVGSGTDEAQLSFAGKNGDAAGTFSVHTTESGLSAVSFKGVEQQYGWYDLNTGDPVEFFPDILKFRHEYEEGVYDVNVARSFEVSKQ